MVSDAARAVTLALYLHISGARPPSPRQSTLVFWSRGLGSQCEYDRFTGKWVCRKIEWLREMLEALELDYEWREYNTTVKGRKYRRAKVKVRLTPTLMTLVRKYYNNTRLLKRLALRFRDIVNYAFRAARHRYAERFVDRFGESWIRNVLGMSRRYFNRKLYEGLWYKSIYRTIGGFRRALGYVRRLYIEYRQALREYRWYRIMYGYDEEPPSFEEGLVEELTVAKPRFNIVWK